ncbi:hypothetical protein [Lewinella sp. IMCC34183]|uniref:hypothetical protein n=1 Tax=Lewinella sp. IMCC34183 TaxID=2248762 RepID=UPI000E289138|nr:hypothetical protein [Lewinella sp. IMCC34183]
MILFIRHKARSLPDEFDARVFATASWSANYCYAAEDRTNLHFYAKGEALHHRLRLLQERDPAGKRAWMPVRVKRRSSLLFDRFGLYDSAGTRLGWLVEPAPGGPPGDFYSAVAAAYS